MPDLSSNLTTIRTSNHWCRAFLSTPSETEVLRGTITATSNEPYMSLTYTNVSGSHTNVLQDMEVEIFRSGVSIGRVRVAPGGATSTVLQIEEVSRGRIFPVANDQFRVYRSWRLRTRLVGATADVKRDSRIAAGTNLDEYAPVANGGGGFVGFVGGGVITVPLNAQNSYTVDPDSSGTLTYLWDVQDGTITVGTSTSSSITATFPAGKRWISITVTDSSNSKSSTQYIPIIACEPTGSNAPQEILITSMTGDAENGWQCTFEALENSAQSALPDGALVMIWNEEYYGTSQTSYGAAVTGRSNIKFVGYLDEDTSTTDPESSERQKRTEFRAVSPLMRLAQLVGFSQAVERKASSTSWLEATGLTTRVMMDYIVRFGSTLQVCHDFLNSAANYDYPAFYLQSGTPFAQLKELVDGVDATLTCDRTGRVHIYPAPLIASASARNSIVTTLTLTEDDILRIEGNRLHWYRYAQLEGRGLTTATTTASSAPVFSRAPGLAPADAPQFIEQDRLIVASQSDLNERTGFRYAMENSLYYGLPTYDRVEVTLRGGYDVFDFYQEWVKLNIASLYNARGIGWDANNQRYVIESIAVDYQPDDGSKQVTLTLKAETIGFAGQTYQPPPDPQSQIEVTPIDLDFSWIDQPIEIPDVQVISNDLPLKVYAIGGAANEISRMVSFNYQTGTGTVEDMDASNTTTGSPLWAFGDPFSVNRFYVLTTDGLWKTDDRTAASPTWTLVANNLAITGNSSHICPYGEMSINRQGFIALGSGSNGLCVSFDYGATWAQYSVRGTLATSNSRKLGFSFAVSPYNNPNASNQGWIYASPQVANRRVLSVNTDWGRGTWTDVYNDALSFTVHGEVAIPYKRLGGVANKNDSNQQVIMFMHSSGGEPRLMSVRKSGTLDYSANPEPDVPPYNWTHRTLNVWTSDGRYVRYLGAGNYIYESLNGGSDLDDSTGLNWTNLATDEVSARSGGGNINGWANDRDIMLTFGTTNASSAWNSNTGWLYYTADRGVTWYNLGTAFGFASDRCQYAELASV